MLSKYQEIYVNSLQRFSLFSEINLIPGREHEEDDLYHRGSAATKRVVTDNDWLEEGRHVHDEDDEGDGVGDEDEGDSEGVPLAAAAVLQ